jgi:hypothetical protein
MSKLFTHGGQRKGAGRPKGKKNANVKGRASISKSVSMPAEAWRKLDIERGTQSRGKFIASKL